MRKLIESCLVSLDGVSEAPEHWANFDAEDTAYAQEELRNYDAFIMGRVTYCMRTSMRTGVTPQARPISTSSTLCLNTSHPDH